MGAGDSPPGGADRVLVVDDDPSAREAMSFILTTAGYNVRLANSSAEALAVLHENPIELALVDLRLGKASGIELMVELRELRPELSVLMVTGAGTIETAMEAMRLGADNFLTNPVSPKNLVAWSPRGWRRARCGKGALAASALERLAADDWPGNVRELRNVIERAASLAPDGEPIDASDLPRRRHTLTRAGEEAPRPVRPSRMGTPASE